MDDEIIEVFTVGCPRCDHATGIDPDDKPTADERLWCAECGEDLGSWSEVQAKLYTPINQMLTETLAKSR